MGTATINLRRFRGASRVWKWRGAAPRRVPVWTWRLLMRILSSHERRAFNSKPIQQVQYITDLPYGTGSHPSQRLDVIVPLDQRPDKSPLLPVYVYFHGGGWTSGDKAVLTKYCASQAVAGMVVINANYRRAPRHHMGQILEDASAVLSWVREHAESYGGDASNIVLGGDSAGGQLAALIAASSTSEDLIRHFRLQESAESAPIRGLVLHCSVVDISVIFERESVLGLGFIRMLVPSYRMNGRPKSLWRTARDKDDWLRREARFLSPIEWVTPAFPPVFLTTSERDYFYDANHNFISRLRRQGVQIDELVYDRSSRNAVHTWQQDPRHPESQEVYGRLHHFVRRVTSSSAATEPT